jgi:signal transduction histidine kinase
VVAIDPRVGRNEMAPAVIIEQVVVDKKPIDLTTLTRAPPEPLRIPRGNGEVEIHYTALSLQAAEKDRFRYRMEGADPDWVNAETRRVAYYSHLRPGKYRFRVSGSNNDGLWSQSDASVRFLLQPLFWETPWFLSLAGIALIGGIAALVRYVSVKRIQRRLAALEQQHAIEKERARIARDIHDDLGATLTQITMLSDRSDGKEVTELRANSKKISATARELAQSLDEIVWAVNPEHDSLEGLVEYLSQSADDFLEETSIRCRLHRPPGLPSCSIPAETRHQLFLAFKEALNNIVKHAEAAEISIEFVADQRWFQILIADDGAGFDSSAPRPNGNGLINMRKRLEAIGGSLDLQTRPGAGTQIRMMIPLALNGAHAMQDPNLQTSGTAPH